MGLLKPVYIHGWGFSSKLFSSLEGIKPDLPGHGNSSENYVNLDTLVEDIALSLPSTHDLIGWSLGGTIAILLALRFPTKVNRLFLVGVSPFFRQAWSDKNIRAFKLRIKREGIESFRKTAFRGDFEDKFNERVALKLLEDYINTDLRPLLPRIRQRAFLIHGIADEVVPPVEAFKLRSFIKGSKLITLPGGHFPAEDERSLLSEILKVC